MVYGEHSCNVLVSPPGLSICVLVSKKPQMTCVSCSSCKPCNLITSLQLEVLYEDILCIVLWYKGTLRCFLVIWTVFSIGVLWMVSHILLSVWFAWCLVFVSGKLICAGYIHWCSIVEVVVCMFMCVNSVAITLLCRHCFDENPVFLRFWRGIYHYLLQLTKCKHFVCLF